ncbi:MAG TPA: hypothetical protein VEY12_05920 [Thermoplasmata archaeon]|nr:hypothetical protein [Thermoplasmata archaeon]
MARVAAGRDEIVLAFSGGLGSLLIAALARKRCDLLCVVVGMRGSADVEAARVAQMFLDYRLAILRPSPSQALRAARRIAASGYPIPLAECLALVPLALVEARQPESLVLSGAGLTARTSSLRRALGEREALSPGLRLRLGGLGRRPLLRMAEAAGLPESFALAAPRSPLEGSGIGPVLRAMARRRGMSVPRLVSAHE